MSDLLAMVRRPWLRCPLNVDTVASVSLTGSNSPSRTSFTTRIVTSSITGVRRSVRAVRGPAMRGSFRDGAFLRPHSVPARLAPWR